MHVQMIKAMIIKDIKMIKKKYKKKYRKNFESKKNEGAYRVKIWVNVPDILSLLYGFQVKIIKFLSDN